MNTGGRGKFNPSPETGEGGEREREPGEGL
jgi:hypothetical protein